MIPGSLCLMSSVSFTLLPEPAWFSFTSELEPSWLWFTFELEPASFSFTLELELILLDVVDFNLSAFFVLL
jgi:hypothetical protein